MNVAVLFRPRAREDLEAHALWIARESSERALAFLEAVESSLQHLSAFPELGTSRDWLAPHCRGIRFFPVRGFPRYLLFYRPVADGLEVIRILHAARDIGAIFSEEP